jgi:hypothetical protein
VAARFADDFDVVEGGGFVSIGDAFDADLIAGAQVEIRNCATSGGVGADFCGGELSVGGPVSDEFVVDEAAKFRGAVFLIEIENDERVVPFRTCEFV